MHIARLLHSQGFGTRRECAALCRHGRVRVDGAAIDHPGTEVEVAEGRSFEVDGQEWRFRTHALVMLNKPAGVECSREPRDHVPVLTLLPAPLRQRGVQPVGRLDADTTGLLLLTDDGALLHRLTSPRHQVAKVYEVTCRHPVPPAQLDALRAGVVLHDDPEPVHALAAESTGERTLRLTIGGGRYHQVKRMLAAAGNRVEALHRSGFGALTLGTLAAGEWTWIDPAALHATAGADPDTADQPTPDVSGNAR
ncbi:MAG: 16S rRNA pseudouridine(516) synthase [Rubrivivax sp.]